jgi:hypothetical protein
VLGNGVAEVQNPFPLFRAAEHQSVATRRSRRSSSYFDDLSRLIEEFAPGHSQFASDEDSRFAALSSAAYHSAIEDFGEQGDRDASTSAPGVFKARCIQRRGFEEEILVHMAKEAEQNH